LTPLGEAALLGNRELTTDCRGAGCSVVNTVAEVVLITVDDDLGFTEIKCCDHLLEWRTESQGLADLLVVDFGGVKKGDRFIFASLRYKLPSNEFAWIN
jgi:hypothetical protein